jgi:hypothetical protein
MITDFVIDPVGGDFDVARVEAFVLGLAASARDDVATDTFLLASDRATLDEAVAARRRDPSRFPFSVILVSISARRITVAYRTSAIEPARLLVDWLRARYPVVIMDDELHDLTAQLADNLDLLFAPDRA